MAAVGREMALADRLGKFGSDATIALQVYMGVNAKGAESIVPAIKR